MRAAVVGLVTIPIVVAGGLGIAAAVGVIGGPSSDSAQASETTTAGPSSTYTAEPGPGGGTAIEGTRPHLTVVDGRAALMLPGSLPAILSVLPNRPITLHPLPSAAELRGEPASRTVDKAPAPHTRAPEVARPQNPTIPPATGGGWTIPPAQAAGGPAQSPSQVGGPQIDPRRAVGSPPGAQVPPGIDPVHNAPGTDRGNPGNGRPAHADQTGRPPHADQTGRPPHASDNGRGNSGNGDAGNTNSGRENSGGGNPGNGYGNGTGNGNGADHTRPSPR